MLFFFSLLFTVLGLGNENQVQKERLLRASGGGGGGGASSSVSSDMNSEGDGGGIFDGLFYNGINPNGVAKEYMSVGLLVGEFMWTFRISMGDFFSHLSYQRSNQNRDSNLLGDMVHDSSNDLHHFP